MNSKIPSRGHRMLSLLSEKDAPRAVICHSSVCEAMLFCLKFHKNQTRHGGDPYVIHPFRVFYYIRDILNINDMYILTVALLHDILEDTDASVDEMQAIFGNVVTDTVLELTNDTSLNRSARVRKMIEKSSTLSNRAKLIKTVDRMLNIIDAAISYTPEKFNRYVSEGLELLDGLQKNIENDEYTEKLHEVFSRFEEVLINLGTGAVGATRVVGT